MAGGNYPSIELVSQCFIYQDGILYWKERPRSHFACDQAWKMWNTRYANEEAGCPSFFEPRNCWRWIVTLSYRHIPRSVIVWAIHYHEWPTLLVDHEDRNSLNDRIENLRLATYSQNRANATRSLNNKSGCKGVSWYSRDGRWQTSIKVNGETIYLGLFDTPEEAHAAYCQAAIEHFGEYACLD